VLDVNRITVSTANPLRKVDEPLIQMQTDHRMYGIVDPKKREERIGQYYRISWKNPQGKQATKLVFKYQRSADKGDVRQQIFELSTGVRGFVEVPIIGKDLATKGRILAWRAELLENNEIIASKESYLWE